MIFSVSNETVKRSTIFPVLALVSVVLLSGCIKLNFYEEVGTTGVSSFTFTMEVVNKSAMKDDASKNPCASINVTNPRVSGVTCRYDSVGKILVISGRFDRSGLPGLTVTGTRYRLNVKQALDDMNEKEKGEDTQSLPTTEDKQQLEELRKTGFEYNYYVKMPGRIVGQSGGAVQPDGYVKFDVMTITPDAYVESDASITNILGGISQTGGAGAGGGGMPSCCCIPALPLLISLAAALVKV